MSPLYLFLYVLMVGTALACLFVVGLACWVLMLTVKGWLLSEASERPRKERRERKPQTYERQ